MAFSSARSADGGTSGTANVSMRTLAVKGNYLYVGKGSNGTACSQSAGSASGCELMVFDITTPGSPSYVAGRDASGTATGTSSATNVNDIRIVGNYLYLVKEQDATACSQTAGSALGCDSWSSTSPPQPTPSTLRDVTLVDLLMERRSFLCRRSRRLDRCCISVRPMMLLPVPSQLALPPAASSWSSTSPPQSTQSTLLEVT